MLKAEDMKEQRKRSGTETIEDRTQCKLHRTHSMVCELSPVSPSEILQLLLGRPLSLLPSGFGCVQFNSVGIPLFYYLFVQCQVLFYFINTVRLWILLTNSISADLISFKSSCVRTQVSLPGTAVFETLNRFGFVSLKCFLNYSTYHLTFHTFSSMSVS